MKENGYIKGEFKSRRVRHARYWWERNGGFVLGAIAIVAAVHTHKRLGNLERFVDAQETFNRDLSVWKGLVMDALEEDEKAIGDIFNELDKIVSKKSRGK